ncbi:MAG: glutamine-hydrolyzing GMP synthase [Bacilli bacterium]|nr:glutamine-hydrolyzing GMP synthase [Bacilli bacterium]
MKHDTIIVIDFGSQYNQLIVRRIRSLGVYAKLVSYDDAMNDATYEEVKGFILSGGPHSVYQKDAFSISNVILEAKKPILGVCYGMQALVHAKGGFVGKGKQSEYGLENLEVITHHPLFKNIPEHSSVWMSHQDEVRTLPNGFVSLAKTNHVVAAIANDKEKIYGVQFHPEVKHTEYGDELLKNFLFEICKANNTWSMKNFVEEQIEAIQKKAGLEHVLMGISGGVDSSVAALLIHRAIPNQLTCIFVDHGLLREGEAEQVMETFKNKYHIDVVCVNARDHFLKKLENVVDPETKRKIIGEEFITIFDIEAKKRGRFAFLGQGTLYTDIIESGTKTAQTIKSHHNVGGLPKEMKFQLIEPLNTLFKDEVRELGKVLGIDPVFVERQPFPGPGLGIRILGAITKEKLEIARKSDVILREEIMKANLTSEIWQYFTVVPDIHSVGVMGDGRTYAHTVAIRAVTSVDGMTADWAKIPYSVLDAISRRIVNEVEGINRVVYDITSKPPATIEWE